MIGGLALPTHRSPDLRVPIFYLVLCSPPPRHARGLGLANLRVTRPVGSNFSYVCSSFNCLTLVVRFDVVWLQNLSLRPLPVRRLHLSLPAEHCKGVKHFAASELSSPHNACLAR
jgi:hypothetical protein